MSLGREALRALVELGIDALAKMDAAAGAATTISQYRELCEEHGNRVDTTAGPTYIAPSPSNLLTLINARMIEREVRGRLRVLREVAQAYLTHADGWQNLSAVELFADLQSVRHIGKWTAGAIVADVTNDFSFYSFSGEPAHGRWRQLFIAMETDLPERDFANLRPELDRNQLSTLVALLLASKTSNGE
jgi:DNA-3-methyladenine glycosylase II